LLGDEEFIKAQKKDYYLTISKAYHRVDTHQIIFYISNMQIDEMQIVINTRWPHVLFLGQKHQTSPSGSENEGISNVRFYL
jgi:hypothetical protein